MSTPTTHPGLFFNIKNDCSSPVRGFAVGDKLCLLSIGSAVFTRAIFQGDMMPGEVRTYNMACVNSEGTGLVLFVPPVSSGAQAVEFRVKPYETISIPSTFCGSAGEPNEDQLKVS